eukprot:augustus_masked-scaffold_5-processed-gene-2.1-mRNA-1 protein AED:0.19 eAED:0.30 QI:0/-1/0/1/-1/1/1/0/476
MTQKSNGDDNSLFSALDKEEKYFADSLKEVSGIKNSAKNYRKTVIESFTSLEPVPSNNAFSSEMNDIQKVIFFFMEKQNELKVQFSWKAVKVEAEYFKVLTQFLESVMLIKFLTEGKILLYEALLETFNSEYKLLAPYLFALMNTCFAVEKRGVALATEINIPGVLKCVFFVKQVHSCLLTFKFRNGQLRRKFDAVKYVVRNLEQKLYLLSTLPDQELKEPEVQALIDEDLRKSFEKLSSAYEKSDNYRESVIKITRDLQKFSKRSIFSLHNGKLKEAASGIEKGIEVIAKLKTMQAENAEHPDNIYTIQPVKDAVEELLEALLFYSFLLSGKTEIEGLTDIVCFHPKPCLSFSAIEECLQIRVAPALYLGALSDFTGEVGRFGVNMASKKDLAAVKRCEKLCEEVNSLFEVAIFSYDFESERSPWDKGKDSPNYVEKKQRAVEMNGKKIKNILLEEIIAQKKNDFFQKNKRQRTE